MPRALQPHTPDDDLAAHGAHAASAGLSGVLTPEVAAFCQGGVSVIIALGGKDAAPVAGLGCGCRLLEENRMRLLLMRAGNEELVSAAERGEPVAATFSQPVTHRSIQVKGSNSGIAAPTENDRLAALRQMDGLREELREIEFTARFAEAYCHVDPDELVAIDFDLDTAFVQTPGPGAGAELKA